VGAVHQDRPDNGMDYGGEVGSGRHGKTDLKTTLAGYDCNTCASIDREQVLKVGT